jgi:ABC-type Fe3+-hydroxamate transport system substrate-binding protein
MRSRLLAMLLATVVVLAACGSDTKSTNSSSSGATRPTTTAQLRIVQPTPNQVVTGTTMTVTLDLTGAKIVPQTSTVLKPDEGHVHLSLDGQIVSMTFGLTDQLNNLTPGSHTLQADFVAADHAPFANRVTAVVLFTVQ